MGLRQAQSVLNQVDGDEGGINEIQIARGGVRWVMKTAIPLQKFFRRDLRLMLDAAQGAFGQLMM
jgi:hypothetical protein